MGVTTKDLAAICGVSRATVTRALHGTGRISEETKKKILDTANRMGYEPDLVARSLVSGKSMTIGVVVVDLENQYYPKLVNAIAQKVLEYDYIPNITVHRDDKNMEQRLIRMLCSHRVDGLILSPINKGESFYQVMEKIDVPYCILGVDEFKDCACVGVDEMEAGKACGEYILKKGYRRSVFISPPMYDADGELNMGHHKRYEGMLGAMTAGRAECAVLTEREPGLYLEQTLEFIRCSKERTALLCSGAIFAVEILGYLARHGYRAPDDFGIMTFDEVAGYEEMVPKLACLDNHVKEIGHAAGEQLVKMMRGEPTERRVVTPYSIIEGQTL